MIRLLAAALALAAAMPVAAQTVAITGGRVLTMGPAGEIERGTVVITGGRIVAVGADVAVPAGAKIIDATGKIVTPGLVAAGRSEEHTSELQSLMRISYAVFCLPKKNTQ